MNVGELMLTRGAITEEQLEAAIERQKLAGGMLSENLMHMGYLQPEQLRELLNEIPLRPTTIKDTGLGEQFLLDFILKNMFVSALTTISELAKESKLSQRVIETILEDLRNRGFVEIVGQKDSQFLLRYVLTDGGKERAVGLLNQSRYNGPAPIPLEEFHTQVEKQTIVNEYIQPAQLQGALGHLVLQPNLIRLLGPAVNSGKATLLYGATGNGKSSVAEALADAFQQHVYIPYAIKVDEQVIKVFDSAIHEPVEPDPELEEGGLNAFGAQGHDPRWVLCRRPLVMSGGELTLNMLDLDFDPVSKHYEAPLQVKATGGIYIIDDFGRQLVRPEDLLNRWIVPLERKVDFLTLHTGKKFQMPFDEIVIFSTNLSPEELMDAAFLRRIKYKIRIDLPTPDDYAEIFRRMCVLYKLPYPQHVVEYLLRDFYPKSELPPSAVHPKMIVEHVVAASKYLNRKPEFTKELVDDALDSLIVTE